MNKLIFCCLLGAFCLNNNVNGLSTIGRLIDRITRPRKPCYELSYNGAHHIERVRADRVEGTLVQWQNVEYVSFWNMEVNGVVAALNSMSPYEGDRVIDFNFNIALGDVPLLVASLNRLSQNEHGRFSVNVISRDQRVINEFEELMPFPRWGIGYLADVTSTKQRPCESKTMVAINRGT